MKESNLNELFGVLYQVIQFQNRVILELNQSVNALLLTLEERDQTLFSDYRQKFQAGANGALAQQANRTIEQLHQLVVRLRADHS